MRHKNQQEFFSPIFISFHSSSWNLSSTIVTENIREKSVWDDANKIHRTPPPTRNSFEIRMENTQAPDRVPRVKRTKLIIISSRYNIHFLKPRRCRRFDVCTAAEWDQRTGSRKEIYVRCWARFFHISFHSRPASFHFHALGMRWCLFRMLIVEMIMTP